MSERDIFELMAKKVEAMRDDSIFGNVGIWTAHPFVAQRAWNKAIEEVAKMLRRERPD